MNPCCEAPAFEPPQASTPGALRTVVLIGPPNSGKSTLFNRLTGLRQKVANYPGVTVEQRMGLMAGVGRDDLTLIDLPGVYSLTPYSEDARVAVDVLKGKMPGTPRPTPSSSSSTPFISPASSCWPHPSSPSACPPWSCSI